MVLVTNFPSGKRNRLGKVTKLFDTSAKTHFGTSENVHKLSNIIPVATRGEITLKKKEPVESSEEKGG